MADLPRDYFGNIMSAIRWWLFKRLSDLGWRICPEPHRSRLLRVMPTREQIRREYALSELAEIDRDICDDIRLPNREEGL